MNKIKVSKKEICKLISKNTGISLNKIELIFNEIFSEIKNNLKNKRTLTIKNFGKFELYHYKNINMNDCSIIKVKKSKKEWKNEKK